MLCVVFAPIFPLLNAISRLVATDTYIPVDSVRYRMLNRGLERGKYI